MPTAMAAPRSPIAPGSKAELRERLRRLRAGGDPASGVRLAQQALAAIEVPSGTVIAGYWPLPGEVDVRPLLRAWAERGHALALPETSPPDHRLVFHRWRWGEALIQGRFRTCHPQPDPVIPGLLLVPLLGFDRLGHRLGYGAGYYDRTIAALPGVRTLGCAFACQEVEAIPAEAHDRRLDAIATENEVFMTGSRV